MLERGPLPHHVRHSWQNSNPTRDLIAVAPFIHICVLHRWRLSAGHLNETAYIAEALSMQPRCINCGVAFGTVKLAAEGTDYVVRYFQDTGLLTTITTDICALTVYDSEGGRVENLYKGMMMNNHELPEVF